MLQPGDQQTWLPWDSPGAVARFLDHYRPSVGVLMETEVWPTLVAECQARGLPLVLANARLSDKSLRAAQRLSVLSRAAYGALFAVWAQTEADAQRLRQLGAPVKAVWGNLKFDATPDIGQLAQGRAWRAAAAVPVVMLASSREGEEEEFLRICAMGSDDTGRVQPRYLVVPRHPQRFEAVAEIAKGLGWRVSRRTTWGDQGPPELSVTGAGPELWLGDSLGEMALYYGMSDVALLGGSFAPLGGQNLIEAAACGCPVVMGAHTFNFAEAADQAHASGAALRAEDMGDAMRQAIGLLADAPARGATARAASQFALAHQGAAQKTSAALAAMLQT